LVVARAQAVARDRFLFGYQTASKVPTEKNTTYHAGKVMKIHGSHYNNLKNLSQKMTAQSGA